MKKILCLFLSLALVVTLVVGIQVKPANAGYRIKVTLTPTMKSIKVKWSKKQGAKRYIVYRADVTKKVKTGDTLLSQKKYKKIATLSGKYKKFKNTKVKKKRYYAYYVEGYTKVNGKYELEYTSYQENYLCAYVGLDKPYLHEYYSDNYITTEHGIYFAASEGVGVIPKKIIIYKKGPNDKKYKKTKLKPGENSDDYPYLFHDTNVKPNQKYKYKAKAYYKQGKKKYYSKFSNVFKEYAKTKPDPDDDVE